MLSTSSFNAILKTLEEPPAHAMFILATTELHKIPATIISRCQRFDFHRIPADEIVTRLQKLSLAEGVEVEVEVLASIARLSEGCLRDAESLLAQVLALGETKITKKEASLVLPATHTDTVRSLLEAAAKKDSGQIVSLLSKSVEEGASMRHLLDELLALARSLLLISLGGAHDDQLDAATRATLDNCRSQVAPTDIEHLLDLLLSARGRSTPSHLPQLPLELALITFCLDHQPTSPSGGSTLRPTEAPAKLSATPLTPSTSSTTTTSASPILEAEAAELKEKWGRCVAYVAEKNMTLPLVLNNAEVLRTENGKVVIGFPYLMHVEKMSETKNKLLLEDAIESILMKRISVQFEHTKNPEATPEADLLEVFGGVVTETSSSQN